MSGSLRALAILLCLLMVANLAIGATMSAVVYGVALLIVAGFALEEAGS